MSGAEVGGTSAPKQKLECAPSLLYIGLLGILLLALLLTAATQQRTQCIHAVCLAG